MIGFLNQIVAPNIHKQYKLLNDGGCNIGMGGNSKFTLNNFINWLSFTEKLNKCLRMCKTSSCLLKCFSYHALQKGVTGRVFASIGGLRLLASRDQGIAVRQGKEERREKQPVPGLWKLSQEFQQTSLFHA